MHAAFSTLVVSGLITLVAMLACQKQLLPAGVCCYYPGPLRPRSNTTVSCVSSRWPTTTASTQQQPQQPLLPGSSSSSSYNRRRATLTVTRASSKQQHPNDAPRPAGPLQSLLAQLVLLLRLAGTALLLVAAMPYLLSTRLGTAATAAAASRMLPGDVRIQRMTLGWTQPVAVHGLAVFEGAAGSSRQLIGLQRFSSAEPLHEVVSGKCPRLTLTLANPSIDGSLADTADNFRLIKYFQESRLVGLLTGRHKQQPQTAVAATVAAAEAAAGQLVEEAEHAAAAAKVHSHPIQLAAAESSGSAEDAATLPPAGASVAAAAKPSPAATTAATTTNSERSRSSKAKASKTTQQQQQEQTSPPPAAAGAGSVLPANFVQRLQQADSSSHVSAELHLPKVSIYIPDGQLLLPQELSAAMGSHIHAVAAAGGAAVHDLGEELDEDCSWLEIQQQQQQQPQSQQQPGDQQQQQSEQQHDHKHWPLFHHKQQQQQQVLSSSSTSAAGHEPWPLPPLKVLSSSHSRKAWQHATPVMLQVSGERVAGLVRGWHMGSILRLSQSSLVLEQPATATWEFTPELAALTMSQFNPLLEKVAYVKEGGQLTTSLAPADGLLPAETGKLWVSPVKLVVERGNLLSQIYRLLGLHGRFGSSSSSGGGSGGHQPWLRGGSSGSVTAAAAAKEAAAAVADDGSALEGLEVWSGPLRVSLEGPGKFRTDRVDMIIGSGRNTLHLALWGTVDTNSNTLAMTVGLPATTLAKAGLRGLPPEYLLPVAVSGPLHRPSVEWNAAVRQLAVLSAMQLGREAWGHEGQRVAGALWGAIEHEQGGGVPAGIAGLFGAANRALSLATSSFIGQVDERLQNELQHVPPPADLPWEHQEDTKAAQKQHQKQHSKPGGKQ